MVHLPDDITVRSTDPVYENIACEDGHQRDTGGIQIHPDIVAEHIAFDFPRDILSATPPDAEGANIFGTEESNLRVFTAVSIKDYDVVSDDIWTGILKEYVPEITERIPNTDKIGEVFLYNPNKQLIIVKRTVENAHIGNYKPSDKYIDQFLLFDTENEEFIESVSTEIMTFYDVPDETLIKMLPEKYYARLATDNL